MKLLQACTHLPKAVHGDAAELEQLRARGRVVAPPIVVERRERARRAVEVRDAHAPLRVLHANVEEL